MSFLGKILIAKEQNMISAVKLGADPASRERYTGERTSINPGTVLMCVNHYSAPTDVKAARFRRVSPIPCLVVLFKEKTWEANPDSFGAVDANDQLQGKTVCFTGNDKAARIYWKTIVQACGGTNVSGVSHKTSFLVMADKASTSTKAVNARKYGTQVLTYQEFQEMLKVNS